MSEIIVVQSIVVQFGSKERSQNRLFEKEPQDLRCSVVGIKKS